MTQSFTFWQSVLVLDLLQTGDKTYYLKNQNKAQEIGFKKPGVHKTKKRETWARTVAPPSAPQAPAGKEAHWANTSFLIHRMKDSDWPEAFRAHFSPGQSWCGLQAKIAFYILKIKIKDIVFCWKNKIQWRMYD